MVILLSDIEICSKYSAEIQEFTLMDDVFMSAVFSDKECAEILLNVVLNKKLTVTDIKTQYSIGNLYGRSIRLDIRAEDENGKVYGCEVENTAKRAIPERARFNLSVMDAEELDKGTDWDKLPDTYIIMITKTDVLGGGKPIYHIEKRIEEMAYKLFGDRSYIIYVNSKIQDNTELGKLMHDFQCKKASDMYNKKLAERADYFKNRKKGEVEMCEIMDRLITKAEKEREQEIRLQDIKNIMINFSMSAQKAMEGLNIDKEEQDKYLRLLGLKA